ncbi:hypothetical protein LguiB_018018 [Lonicera macranthoides]
MAAAWQPKKKIEMKKLKKNLFMFQFSYPMDRRKALRGRPWLLVSNIREWLLYSLGTYCTVMSSKS